MVRYDYGMTHRFQPAISVNFKKLSNLAYLKKEILFGIFWIVLVLFGTFFFKLFLVLFGTTGYYRLLQATVGCIRLIHAVTQFVTKIVHNFP